MSNASFVAEQEVEVIAVANVFDEESEEPPMEEWSSIDCFMNAPQLSNKKQLYEEGLFVPPTEEICSKYISCSASSVYRHPYYKYPCVKDPGIETALFNPPPVTTYSDDGQELYKALCEEMNLPFCRIFHKQLVEEHINMRYYGIGPYGWRPMAIALKANRIVKSIDFTSNFISQDGCFHIGDMLGTNFTIVELDFTGCRMGPKGVEALVANLVVNKTLRKLNLSNNELADEGMSYICYVLSKDSSITCLNLKNNTLTSNSATSLAEALEFFNKITHLDLSFNSLTVPRPLEMLVSTFLPNEAFVEINLAWNSLTTRFSKALCNLMRCPNIKIINLSNNNLTGEVIINIGSNLQAAKQLLVLDLSYNPLTMTEAKLLLGYLKSKTVKLQKLLMDGVMVNEDFLMLKSRLLSLRYRKKSVVTHGYVVMNYIPVPADMRNIVLSRAEFLCSKPKKKMVDVGLMILELNKEMMGEENITYGQLSYFFKKYGAFQINKDLLEEIAAAFPGPKMGKERLVNLAAMVSYVKRKWPECSLPKTPPSAPLLPPPPPPQSKNKKEKKKN